MKKIITVSLGSILIFSSVSTIAPKTTSANVNLENTYYSTEKFLETLNINDFTQNVTNLQQFSTESSISEEIIVTDDAGNPIKVTLIENAPLNNNTNPTTRLYQQYPIGYELSYTIKLSNEDLGLPSIVGGGISYAAKKRASQAAAAAIAAKLGSKFIPGVNLASYILGVGAWANAVTGKAGIMITVYLKYSSVYLNKEGHYYYGWSPTGLSISRY